MSEFQERRERSAGDRFIAWYNHRRGTQFMFSERGSPAPDLIYRSGNLKLGVEVTEAFYDRSDALFKMKSLRGEPDAPRAWATVVPDPRLATHIGYQIHKKSLHAHRSACVLLVDIDPTVTNPDELEALLPTISLPPRHTFEGIYVGGVFGFSAMNPEQAYKCWPIFEA